MIPIFYHVRIRQKSTKTFNEARLDLTREELEKQFLLPYREGRPITINGRTIPLDDLDQILINQSDVPSKNLELTHQVRRKPGGIGSSFPAQHEDWFVAARGEDVTNNFITGPPGEGSSIKNDTDRENAVQNHEFEYDFFISHASEDKDAIAKPLAKALVNEGFRVWYDDDTLILGDKLRRSIDKGLLKSRFGIVILSHNFFKKEWTNTELDGFAARERKGVKVILPIWHEVTYDEVLRYSPTLAERNRVSTSKGLDYIVNEIIKAVNGNATKDTATAMSKPFEADLGDQAPLNVASNFKLQPGYTGREHNYAFILEIENITPKTIKSIEINIFVPKLIYNGKLTKVRPEDSVGDNIHFVFSIDRIHPGKKITIDKIYYRVNYDIEDSNQYISLAINWEIYADDMIPIKSSRPLSELQNF